MPTTLSPNEFESIKESIRFGRIKPSTGDAYTVSGVTYTWPFDVSPNQIDTTVIPKSPNATLADLPKKKIAVGILGQSNERGEVAVTDMANYPQAFSSLRKPSLRYPLQGVITKRGGMWFKFYDDLYDFGYDATIINQARGSLSIIKHLSGQVTFRNNSQPYRQQRPQIGSGDLGDFGDVIVMSGKVFACTTGILTYLQYWGNQRIPNTTTTYLDYVLSVGSATSAASDPATWASATLGSTVVDGGITWTCIDATNSIGYSSGSPLAEPQIGLGFDPMGMLLELHNKMAAIQDVTDKYIIVCNAQSDTWAQSAWYQIALQSIANFYTSRGYKVLLGLSCYDASGSNIAAYNNLTTGLNAALASYSAGSGVYAGANLYTLMGSTGNMGAGGAWFQPGSIHLNGAGAIVAGGHHANALKAAIQNP